MRRSLYLAGVLALAAGVLQAQSGRARSAAPSARVYSYDRYDDRDRAALGITTSSGGLRDTLGLLVQSVTAGSPADKAGIEEGNRLVSVNGVNLRLSAADAGEGDMEGIANRRLIRELEKVKAGDEVTLELWAGGQTKSVKVKTVAVEDLPSRARASRREADDRPVVGLSLSATGSRRDTLGMLVVRVTTDGPAEKAGIVEGDRIAAINGVSLRVASEDAGDPYMSSARMNRYRRELAKVTLGEDVELSVYTGGQTKTVRVKPVRAADLPRQRGGVMIIGDGAVGFGDMFPALPSMVIPPDVPMAPMAPRAPRIFEFDGNLHDGIRMRLDPRARVEIQQQAGEAARRAREAAAELLERLERIDIERRADGEATDAVVAPPAARVRAGSRIASAGAGAGASVRHGYGTAPVTGYASTVTPGSGSYTYTSAPKARAVSGSGGVVTVRPAVGVTHAGESVAFWAGDDATFTLQGLHLARVNDDLAENLGRGSERGFLVLDTGDSWSGLRSGDVLIGVDGHPVQDGRAARIALDSGEDHTAEVIRDGRRRIVRVNVQ